MRDKPRSSGIPFHDDQLLPPDKRVPGKDEVLEIDLYEEVCTVGFFMQRDNAFSAIMELHRILSFLDKYSIPYQDPEISYRPNPDFWAMCYACVLISGAGSDGSKERASAWMNRSAQIGYNIRHRTYRVGNRVYELHPLLSRKRKR